MITNVIFLSKNKKQTKNKQIKSFFSVDKK